MKKLLMALGMGFAACAAMADGKVVANWTFDGCSDAVSAIDLNAR